MKFNSKRPSNGCRTFEPITDEMTQETEVKMTKIKVVYTGDYRTASTHPSGAQIETEAPKDNHGKGEAFSPGDLIAASLGSCVLTMIGIAGRKLGLDLKGITAEVDKEMVSVPHRMIGKLVIRVRCSQPFDSQVREKLEKAAIECPVHRSLHPDIKCEFDFVWGL